MFDQLLFYPPPHRSGIYSYLKTGCRNIVGRTLRFGVGDVVGRGLLILNQLLTVQGIKTGATVESWVVSFSSYERLTSVFYEVKGNK